MNILQLKLAYKNILSNRPRTIVTILLSIFSTAILIFSSTLMDGEHKIMLKNAVEIYPSYIQITHKEFIDNPSFDNLIFEQNETISKIKKLDGVESITARFETFALFSTEEKSFGVMIGAINPTNEAKTSRLKSSLIKGEFLNSSDKNSIYIGEELAKRLNLKIGDRLSFISNAVDYSFCADNVFVKGIFKTGLYEFDLNSAFINKNYFDEIFLSKNIATHLIVIPKIKENSLSLSNQINKTLPKEYLSRSWEESMQSLLKAMEMDSIFGYITLGIFFLVIFFVIMIYTMLSIFARRKEIGVLRAIGTTPNQIFAMLLYESLILSSISMIIGGLIGAYLAYYFSINPIELSSEYEEQFKQYALATTALPTEFNIFTIIRDMIIIFVLNIISTLYPIIKVNKITPSKAIKNG